MRNQLVFLGGVGKPLAREVVERWSEVGTVAATFLIATQYWEIREHLVYLLLLVYASATFLFSRRSIRLNLPRLLIVGFFTTFLFWLMASASWSPTPHMSIAYGLLTFLLGVSACLQGLVIGIRNFVLGLILGVGFQVTRSILLYFAQDGESLSGLYTNRSSMSLVIGIALVALPFAVTRSRASWLAFGSIFTFFFVYLVELNILTSFFALSGALVCGFALLHLRRQRARVKTLLSVLYVSGALVGGSVFWFFREPLLGLIGEDSSMSERVPLWGLYFEAVLWRPVFGSGWGSTVGWDFPLSPDRLSPVAEWFPAHNGYLDVALMLGFVGLGLFLGVLAMLLFVSLSEAGGGKVNIRVMFIPVLLVYLMINDMAATSFPKLLGIYLVGTLVGLAVAKPPSSSDKLEIRSATARP